MRAINLILAASGLGSIFIAMVLASALITSAVHAHLSSRTIPAGIVQN